MDEVPLSDDLKEKFYTFIDTDPRITSLHTVKSYKFIAEKVFDNYDSISKDTIRAILKRYGKKGIEADRLERSQIAMPI